MKVYLKSIIVTAMLTAVCSLTGCGPSEPAKVIGTATIKVTHDGKPVTEGSVSMVELGSAKAANGTLNETGTVTLENVEAGNYVVSVLPPPLPGADPTKPAAP